MEKTQDWLRDFARLNGKRTGEGVTPLEYLRWLDLRQRLARTFPDHPPLGRHGLTRVVVEFQTCQRIKDAVMFNVRPIGLFINTPFSPETGTEFEIRVRLLEPRGSGLQQRGPRVQHQATRHGGPLHHRGE